MGDWNTHHLFPRILWPLYTDTYGGGAPGPPPLPALGLIRGILAFRLIMCALRLSCFEVCNRRDDASAQFLFCSLGRVLLIIIVLSQAAVTYQVRGTGCSSPAFILVLSNTRGYSNVGVPDASCPSDTTRRCSSWSWNTVPAIATLVNGTW